MTYIGVGLYNVVVRADLLGPYVRICGHYFRDPALKPFVGRGGLVNVWHTQAVLRIGGEKVAEWYPKTAQTEASA